MTFRLSAAAENDLTDIYLFGRKVFGLRQTEAYYDSLIRTFDLLSEFPTLGRIRYEVESPAYMHPFKSHLIFYLRDDNGITILRIRHASENWSEAESDS
ncbi:type II toxin-antitoxin system RelE/ParE family toxin [Asticcacaulis sp. YBE204]|uniref:type II toxin-antitoxin system RelE/ParE family toxin n=1 Tax=Asticcacaulis sp. YBE204 TaxID=1282363 RepID=UPI0003C3B053|nr:hypothetical protein AEYBE204_05100 [Asticcacaulis sp. YBE204]